MSLRTSDSLSSEQEGNNGSLGNFKLREIIMVNRFIKEHAIECVCSLLTAQGRS